MNKNTLLLLGAAGLLFAASRKRLRVWVFADFDLPSTENQAAWVSHVAGLGFSDVVFGLNSIEDQDFRVHLSHGRMVSVAAALQSAGVGVHLMTWLRPRKAYIEAAEASLGPLCRELGARSLLFDCEGPWVDSFHSHQEEALEAFDRRFRRPWVVPLGVTSYADLPPQVAPLVPRCDYALPQAYSIWDERIAWSMLPRYQPGAMQRRSAELWRDARHLVMGLACYSQTRPKMTQKAAMQTALDATLALGVQEVAYWSLKWLSGSAAARERAEVIRAAT